MYGFRRQIKRFAGIALASLCVISAAAGCSSAAQNEITPVGKPAVTISYSAAFNGETSAGYLNLIIDMNVKNDGQNAFDASAASFLVKVGEYTHIAAESQMPEVELTAGNETSGWMRFEVPPQAATPRTGYELLYTGKVKNNIEWVKSAAAPSVAAESTAPAIDITYSTNMMWLTAPGTAYVKVSPPGSLYMVVEMTIENKGYESFSTGTDYFSLLAGSAVRSVTSTVEKGLIDWREMNIQNNGKFTGSLAFLIPTEAAQSFYPWDFKLQYSGVRSYNIRWSQMNIVKLKLDAEETELDTVSLANGDSIRGKIAYFITPELTASNIRYEMKYDLSTNHNVQWFDKPGAVADTKRNPLAEPAIKITYSTSIAQQESGGARLIVDVFIENKGYESFVTSPGHLLSEARY